MKVLNILEIYSKFGIEYKTSGVKQSRKGWVQTACCFCGSSDGWHLGYCYDKISKYAGSFICYKCGYHNQFETLKNLLKSKKKAYEILNNEKYFELLEGYNNSKIYKNKFKYPNDIWALTDRHKNYLLSRKFIPKKIQQQWGVFSGGPLSSLLVENETRLIDYSNRIIIPFKHNNQIVTFQTRDVTGKHKLKYLACPKEYEIISNKHILYGHAHGKKCIVVEGVTDVWRLGAGSFSTQGIKYTKQQIKFLANFEEVFILYDNEVQAQAQAQKLKGELNFRGTRATVLTGIIATDPGEMSQYAANELMKKILK